MTTKRAMAATYTEVSLEDMEKYLKRAFRALRPKQGVDRGEIYYDMQLGKFVGIRVWTSIHRGQSTGAGVGQDAIRVGLISLKDKGPLQKGKLPIVKRTQNWRDSLKDRIEAHIETYEEKNEFWEQWAETRKVQSGPTMVRDPDPDQQDERDQEDRPEPPPPPKQPAQYNPDRMVGGITDAQANFLRILLRGVTQQVWGDIDGERLTGLDEPPTRDTVRRLTKGQASRLIDTLKQRGGRRYAVVGDQSIWKVEC